MIETWTAFDTTTLVAHGALPDVLRAARDRLATGPRRTLLLFDDASGRLTDIDATSTPEEALAALRPEEARRAGPGRPKLGVVSREVSLLPRHWEWLGEQPGGASAAIRRLVDEARKVSPGAGRVRAAREAAWRFLSHAAPDVPGAESSSRALFAGRYAEAIPGDPAGWPPDVLAHYARLVAVAAALEG